MAMKCKIEIVTPCHIGAGDNKLIKDINFVVDGDRVGVVSPEKIYSLLGDEGIDKWCNAIDRKESIWKVVKTQNANARLEDICDRVMECCGAVCTELGEQIASNGTPYIPGSSIKGAIVSAIVGECRDRITLPTDFDKSNIIEQLLVKPVEKRGQITYNPQNSLLRFLRVSDAYFDNVDTVAMESYGLNLREDKSIVDKKARMLVECIDSDSEATVTIQRRADLYNESRSVVPPLPQVLSSEAAMLTAINDHTRRLLEAEKKFWCEQKKRDYYHVDTNDEQEELDCYLNTIDAIIDHCDCCTSGKSAIMRVGYGSGWRFMTGGYVDNEGLVKKIAHKIRTKRERTADNRYVYVDHYQQYDFPKTRRIADYTPLGFVKISRIK